MNEDEKVVLGVMAGVVIGATLGILFAPDKGSETRTKIAKKSEGLMEGLEEQFNEFINSVNQKFEELKAEASHAAAKSQTEAENALSQITDDKKSH